MAHTTACDACRRLKVKCREQEGSAACIRCNRLGVICEKKPRQLGRKLGSVNRPKQQPREGETQTTSTPPIATPSDKEQKAPRTPAPLGFEPSDHMLNTLAEVAEKLPEQGSSNADHFRIPFNRGAFVSRFRDQAKSLDTDPYKGIALLEDGLDALLDGDPNAHMQPTGMISRVDEPRKDVLPKHDPITKGLITEAEAADLLDMYWERCHSITCVLDRELHTMAYLRANSGLLLSVMLLTAAQCLPLSRHLVGLAEGLDGHIEMLLNDVGTLGLQSVEICQALMIYMTYLKGPKQHQTWQYIAQSIALALELHLDWQAEKPEPGGGDRAHRNIQRTWLMLLDWDRGLAFLRGRRPLLPSHVLSSESALRAWSKHQHATPVDFWISTKVSFRECVESLRQRFRRQIQARTVSDFTSYQHQVDSALNEWRDRHGRNLPEEWDMRITHMFRCARLSLLLAPLKDALQLGAWTSSARQVCLTAALEICRSVIPMLAAHRPVQEITAFILYLTCYSAFTALHLVETKTSDSSHSDDQDLYALTIVFILGKSLLERQSHANMGTTTSALGRQLMNASQRIASVRFPKEADGSTAMLLDLPSVPMFTDDTLNYGDNFVWGSSDLEFSQFGGDFVWMTGTSP